MGGRIANLAGRAGHDVVLAGRSRDRLAVEAVRLKVPWRSADPRNPAGLDAMLAHVDVVVNTAGPFSNTAPGIMRACIRNGCHYVDLSNESNTFQDAWSLDDDARAAGASIVPGAGFGTVAAEALAAHVLGRIRHADSVTLVRTSGGGPGTPGVKATVRELLARPGAGMRHGQWITRGHRLSFCELPEGARAIVPVALGDAFAIARATGIPNVAAYASTTINMGWAKILIPTARVLGRAARVLPGPITRHRSQADCMSEADTRLWLRASNPPGDTATSCLYGETGSGIAAETALRAAQALLLQAPPGTYTAGQLLGHARISQLPGTHIVDF
ncbi:hypothetical protein G6035_03600 [Arthrobacter sp. SDTb3-6]|nr:hypothetical protein [Arthrobacter sp. SDTb3-6]